MALLTLIALLASLMPWFTVHMNYQVASTMINGSGITAPPPTLLVALIVAFAVAANFLVQGRFRAMMEMLTGVGLLVLTIAAMISTRANVVALMHQPAHHVLIVGASLVATWGFWIMIAVAAAMILHGIYVTSRRTIPKTV